jgi:hypothetical protein
VCFIACFPGFSRRSLPYTNPIAGASAAPLDTHLPALPEMRPAIAHEAIEIIRELQGLRTDLLSDGMRGDFDGSTGNGRIQFSPVAICLIVNESDTDCLLVRHLRSANSVFTAVAGFSEVRDVVNGNVCGVGGG